MLAAIIMVNLLGMFRQMKDIPALWRTSKIELVSVGDTSNLVVFQPISIYLNESLFFEFPFSLNILHLFGLFYGT